MPMLQSKLFEGNFDRLGEFASIACVIHCVATPMLLSLSIVFAHFLPSEEHTHRVLAVCIAVIGAIALVTGYRKHKRRLILGLMGVGLTLIFTGAWFGDLLPSHGAELAVTLGGSAFMIVAHRMNHTFCRQCTRCS
ncbi:MerC domain-containing protein [Granulicella arctica]|uniref:MerC domain-containing protein n=1 Tax=Granulicella arctica TaxID=940613 RepID=UPI0021E05C41|nr:MerC domain-containing protein [Granulicella arctica]